ncbi:hypothetical protein [Sulfurimonas sp. ST-27]|uniref:hypothetical protein n=1 Tax=Sulfurimonas sp. ST-27 TaxID=3400152 RepID=UPI003AB75F94
MESEFNKIKEIKNRTKSIDEFKELLKNEQEAVQQAVLASTAFSENMQIALATDISTPLEVMVALLKSHYVVVRNCLAANEKCPLEIIKMFFEKRDALMGVASNPNTPKNLLESIFYIDNGIYKEFLSTNISAPNKILEELSADEDEYIRINLASNLSATEKILTVLARDISKEVRSKVASNPNTPTTILDELVQDSSYVSGIAKNNLKHRKSDQEKITEIQKKLHGTVESDFDEMSLL